MSSLLRDRKRSTGITCRKGREVALSKNRTGEVKYGFPRTLVYFQVSVVPKSPGPPGAYQIATGLHNLFANMDLIILHITGMAVLNGTYYVATGLHIKT